MARSQRAAAWFALWAAVAAAPSTRAQEMEPRAYAPSPVALNFVNLTLISALGQ